MENTHNIEATILSTILFGAEFKDDELIFKINPKYFIHPFHKRVAQKINEGIDNDTLWLCSYEIEEKVKGTNYEDVFLNMLSKTPVVYPKKLYGYLIDKYYERKTNERRG